MKSAEAKFLCDSNMLSEGWALKDNFRRKLTGEFIRCVLDPSDGQKQQLGTKISVISETETEIQRAPTLGSLSST